MSREFCGRCGRIVSEGGAVVVMGPAGAEPSAPATLCDDCRDLLLAFLGPRAFRVPTAPQKAVVDHGRFQTR